MKRFVCCLTFSAAMSLFVAISAVSADVKEGQKAPDVQLTITQPGKGSKMVRLSDLAGKNVVVYFFPKALTKG